MNENAIAILSAAMIVGLTLDLCWSAWDNHKLREKVRKLECNLKDTTHWLHKMIKSVDENLSDARYRICELELKQRTKWWHKWIKK